MNPQLIVLALSLAVILIVSQRSLWVAIIAGCILLSLASDNPPRLLLSATRSILGLDIILLALALAEIPIIGKILEDDLQRVFASVDPRFSAIAGPSTLGLLPIPGGAVLSCPIVDRSLGEFKDCGEKIAINIWFRHIIFLIYPLSTILIVTTALARLNIIIIVSLFIPIFLLGLTIGYLLYLRDVPRDIQEDKHTRTIEHSWISIVFIGLAPAIQISLAILGVNIYIATFISVSVVLILTIFHYRLSIQNIAGIALEGKVWNFSLILLSILMYGDIFTKAYGKTFTSLRLGVFFLLFAIPFALGFLTGRVQLSAIIVIPLVQIYLGGVSYGAFIIVLSSALSGYLMSPAHPCLALSSRYFDCDVHRPMKKLFAPCILLALISFAYGVIIDTKLLTHLLY